MGIVISPYLGPLKNPNDMPDGQVKKAYISWREQRTRCYNSKRAKYANYGAKGIEVKYSSREFIGWWIEAMSGFSGTDPTIGRINHSDHYRFGNVVIQSRAENSEERNRRGPTSVPARPVDVSNAAGVFLFRCISMNEAARRTGFNLATVANQCRRGRKISGRCPLRFNFSKST
jgi:hypothetical protein